MLFARKVWHSKRFQWFSPKISKNAWSVAKKMIFTENQQKRLKCHIFSCFWQEKCDTTSVFNDFHIKSAQTLGVSHFFMLLARKVWHSKRFQGFSPKISKNAGSVAKKQWFSPKINKNAWSVTLFACFWREKFDTPSVFNDFHLKSAKTLGVSHFFMLLARKVWHSQRFQWFSPKISKNAWSVTLFHVFGKKSETLQAFSMIFT